MFLDFYDAFFQNTLAMYPKNQYEYCWYGCKFRQFRQLENMIKTSTELMKVFFNQKYMIFSALQF